ncbi:MAG TPA: flagella assembly protein FlgT middle domain-containing protein [Cellvibrio sp.]|nr:flagella assembly protein FlgT middle domain-containing protein [Cellvibrio sp.]
MLISSRLLGLVLLAAINSYALAQDASSESIAAQEVTASQLPFDNRSLPVATDSSTSRQPSEQASEAIKPVPVAAPVVESVKMSFNQCSDEKRLQKSILVTAFPQRHPKDGNAGNLYQAEYQLPELLGRQLAERNSTLLPQQLREALAAPEGGNQTQLAMQAQRLGSHYRSQIILSGEIVDMAMAKSDSTYNPGLYTRFVNGTLDLLGIHSLFDTRDRLFSFQVQLRDGFTGQTLFSKRYDTYGIWNEKKAVGFGTPRFWQTDYGQQVKGLLKMASAEISEIIHCQPFIAQIDSRPGQTQIIVQGGANNGLHAGDTMALYQLVAQGSDTRYQEHNIRLVSRNAEIELREVYPSHSVGVITTPSYLTGQLLAMAP